MEKKKYFYFYKITNTINDMYYYGVHSTIKLDDGYMGSGHYLKAAQEKYGIQNFKKEILKFFENRDDMMSYEREIVNHQMINKNNPMCYNIALGGWGSHREIDSPLKGRKLPKSTIEKCLATKKAKGTYERISEENKGYNNPEFKNLWKEVYEKDMYSIVNIILNTDLSDEYIVKRIFNKNVKVPRLIKYYEYLGLLVNLKEKEMKARIVNLDRKHNCLHQTPLTLKSIYENSNIKPTAVYLEDYFTKLPELLSLLNDNNISDSKLRILDKEGNTYCDMIKYFKYLKVLNEKCVVKATTIFERKTDNGVKIVSRRAPKTIYDVDFNRAKDSILFDKEFNTYGIENDGTVIRKGRLF